MLACKTGAHKRSSLPFKALVTVKKSFMAKTRDLCKNEVYEWKLLFARHHHNHHNDTLNNGPLHYETLHYNTRYNDKKPMTISKMTLLVMTLSITTPLI